MSEKRDNYTFRFTNDSEQREAKRILDHWIEEYRQTNQTEKSGLSEILTNLILEFADKDVVKPPSERRMFQILFRDMDEVKKLLLDLKNRAPEQFRGAVEQAQQDGYIDDDMFNSLLSDFNNVEGR